MIHPSSSKLIVLSLALSLSSALVCPSFAQEQEQSKEPAIPKIIAGSAMVIDALTGETLFEKNPDKKRAVASTQKLLTALIVSESERLDERVKVEPVDTDTVPSILGIQAGEEYLQRDLLVGLLVKSGNDVARCLGRTIAGSEKAFAALMNKRAETLGMADSNFINASGLTEKGQHSTARDMARLAYVTYRDPIIRSIVEMHEIPFQFFDGSVKTFQNTNELLKSSPACHGMKTGYTRASGRCLISSGTHMEQTVLVVVLGSSWNGVWEDSHKLLHWSLGLPIPEKEGPKGGPTKKKKRS